MAQLHRLMGGGGGEGAAVSRVENLNPGCVREGAAIIQGNKTEAAGWFCRRGGSLVPCH